ncbi:MAG: serine/threonine protein kinase [Labilithrix sp.]|nr:serine/threonine protein kinase [Labilithrix sp.]
MGDGADPRARERVGSVLDEKWTLEHLLGSGGMGAVYAARHRNGARSAVKILHPELARIAEVRERFLREGYAANRVEHRGVVQVLDDDIVKSGPDEGSAYIVMELLEGESLQERAARAPKLGERALLEVMEAVLDVLTAAHERGVIHRDLKPENVFLADDPEREGVRVKVLDFGLARLSEAAAVTSAGIAVGTPSFMSPEQAAGRSEDIDGRTDLFALGATMFRIVTGQRIHDAENMVVLVTLMATVPAPRLRSIMPDVSESFARVIDRALAFDRADRYRDAAAMRADVRAALELSGGRASAMSLQVIPFSARNVRVGSASEIAPEEAVPARPRAKSAADATPVEKAAELVDGDDEAREPAPPAPAARTIAQSPTLPWAIVLVLLAIGAWKLGPSLQDELVRRASLEPVRRLWSPAAAEEATDRAPSATGATGASTEPLEIDDDAATPAAPSDADAAPSAAPSLAEATGEHARD